MAWVTLRGQGSRQNVPGRILIAMAMIFKKQKTKLRVSHASWPMARRIMIIVVNETMMIIHVLLIIMVMIRLSIFPSLSPEKCTCEMALVCLEIDSVPIPDLSTHGLFRSIGHGMDSGAAVAGSVRVVSAQRGILDILGRHSGKRAVPAGSILLGHTGLGGSLLHWRWPLRTPLCERLSRHILRCGGRLWPWHTSTIC